MKQARRTSLAANFTRSSHGAPVIRVALPLALALLLGGLATRGASADQTSDTKHLGTLNIEHSLFWDGVFPFSLDPGDLAWEVELVGNGHRLRVALDMGSIDTTATTVRLIDPSGAIHECGPSGQDGCSVGEEPYSVEIFAEDPDPGTWRIELDPGGICGRNFLADPTDCPGVEWRMRAKLEAARPTAGAVLRLPNLRVEPPFAFDRTLAFTCLPEEIAEWRETTCLRFSFGPQNAGEGPFDLRLSPLDADLIGDVTQLIHYRDATRDPEARLAGTYEFHLHHRHFHVQGYSEVKLYKVVDPQAGSLVLDEETETRSASA